MSNTYVCNGNQFKLHGYSHIDSPEVSIFGGSALFQRWIDSIHPDITIKSVTMVSVDFKADNKPIFAKLSVEAHGKDGKRILPDVVFLRGDSVAILPILTILGSDEKFVILTSQVRLPVGDPELVEIPAGMLDQSSNFIGVAAREFEEEVGMRLDPAELIPLTPDPVGCTQLIPFEKPIALSPGACDEGMRFFLFRKEVSGDVIKELQGKLTGNKDEGEMICLLILPLEQVPYRTRDGKFFIAYALAKLQGLF
ncbi:MAG: NUDIX domain-containing protein [Patescibacteria group bacterium]